MNVQLLLLPIHTRFVWSSRRIRRVPNEIGVTNRDDPCSAPESNPAGENVSHAAEEAVSKDQLDRGEIPRLKRAFDCHKYSRTVWDTMKQKYRTKIEIIRATRLI